MNEPAPAHRPLLVIISGLGIAQIISWGSFYYSIAVLGDTMRRDLGVSTTALFGAFTFSLLVSGLVAPTVGRMIDARGGRVVLASGSLLGFVSLLAMASSIGTISLALASILCGLAMAICLYEAAFITLNQVAGERYRSSVTILTLFGGFASTAFWPLSQLLLPHIGWRWTIASYALLQLFVCLPLHWFLVPKGNGASRAPARASAKTEGNARPTHTASGKPFHYLALAFAIGSFVLSALSVHIISLLTGAGLSANQAVAVAALIGPMQVLIRLIEFAFARNMSPVAAGSVSFVLMVMATICLYFVNGLSALAFLAVGLYGFSNGLMTVIRGTVPAVLFGREGYGELLGRLARPAFVARALAPFGFSLAVGLGLLHSSAILLLAGCSGLAGLAYLKAISHRSV